MCSILLECIQIHHAHQFSVLLALIRVGSHDLIACTVLPYTATLISPSKVHIVYEVFHMCAILMECMLIHQAHQFSVLLALICVGSHHRIACTILQYTTVRELAHTSWSLLGRLCLVSTVWQNGHACTPFRRARISVCPTLSTNTVLFLFYCTVRVCSAGRFQGSAALFDPPLQCMSENKVPQKTN